MHHDHERWKSWQNVHVLGEDVQKDKQIRSGSSLTNLTLCPFGFYFF